MVDVINQMLDLMVPHIFLTCLLLPTALLIPLSKEFRTYTRCKLGNVKANRALRSSHFEAKRNIFSCLLTEDRCSFSLLLTFTSKE